MNDEPYPLRFDVDYPEELSDTVIVLNEGRVEQQGTVREQIAFPASDFVRSITGAG